MSFLFSFSFSSPIEADLRLAYYCSKPSSRDGKVDFMMASFILRGRKGDLLIIRLLIVIIRFDLLDCEANFKIVEFDLLIVRFDFLMTKIILLITELIFPLHE